MKDLIKEILDINVDRVRKYKRDILIVAPTGKLFDSFKDAFVSKFGYHGSTYLDINLNEKNHLCLIVGAITAQCIPHFDTVVVINPEDIDPRVLKENVTIPASLNGNIPTLESVAIYV